MSHNPTRLLSDTLFIQEFRDFCRSKGSETYDCLDADACALAQFGHPDVNFSELRGVPVVAFRAAMDVDVWDPGALRFDLLADRLDTLIANDPGVVGEGR